MKYLVCDSWGNELENFESEAERTRWLRRYAYFNGIHWIVYDLASFPYKVTSRVLYLDEE